MNTERIRKAMAAVVNVLEHEGRTFSTFKLDRAVKRLAKVIDTMPTIKFPKYPLTVKQIKARVDKLDYISFQLGLTLDEWGVSN